MNQRHAFTLIELVIVVLVLAIVAAVAAPKLLNNVTSAEFNATMSNIRAIEDAASMHLAQEGKWPSFTYWYSPTTNNLPGDFEGYLHERIFRQPPPIGGLSYTWYNISEYVGVAIFDPDPDVNKWLALDVEFDDGNSSTGSIVISPYDNRYLIFVTGTP